MMRCMTIEPLSDPGGEVRRAAPRPSVDFGTGGSPVERRSRFCRLLVAALALLIWVTSAPGQNEEPADPESELLEVVEPRPTQPEPDELHPLTPQPGIEPAEEQDEPAFVEPPLQEPIDELAQTVQSLRARASALAAGPLLVDSLYYGWFDRPYGRATLAIAIKIVSVLEQEAAARAGGGAGVLSDDAVADLVAWTRDALTRCTLPEPFPQFRPHRFAIPYARQNDCTPTTPLIGFVDEAGATRVDRVYADLDLQAAMGLRAYARRPADLQGLEQAELLRTRGHALGVATYSILEAGDPADAEVQNVGAVFGCQVTPFDLRTALRTGVTGERVGDLYAIVPPQAGERWTSALARAALLRGIGRGVPFASYHWRPAAASADPRVDLAAVRAGLWLHALDEQSLTLLDGWRDPSVDGEASILADPHALEVIAYTALDLLRIRTEFPGFWRGYEPGITLQVGPDAIDPTDPNRWAPWIEDVWVILAARQIRYHVVPAAMAPPANCVLFRVSDGGTEALLTFLERNEVTRAYDGRLNPLVIVREPSGERALNVVLRSSRDDLGRQAFALVNLSPQPRTLRLDGDLGHSRFRDALSGRTLARPDVALSLEPWQVLVLAPQ